MQITPVNNNNNTNFGALKNIRIEGREFHKRPEVAKQILERIRANETMTDFFKRWDTDVVLNASNIYGNQVKTSIVFLYRELPTGNKFIDFLRKFKDSKHISQESMDWSFDGAVKNLMEYLDQGTLMSQIHHVNSEADKVLADRAAKMKVIKEELAKKEAEIQSRTAARSELDDLIKDMTT